MDKKTLQSNPANPSRTVKDLRPEQYASRQETWYVLLRARQPRAVRGFTASL